MHVLDLVFPRRCVGCGTFGRYICHQCQRTVVARKLLCPECDRPAIDGMTHERCLRPYGLDGLVSIFQNTGVVKQAIKALKYRFVYDLSREFIELFPFSDYLLLRPRYETALYPLPLHLTRFRWRGFNQAEKLGTFVAKKLNIPLVDGLLVRKEKRIPQADIKSRDDRILNARGLFIVSSKLLSSKPLSLLLFDDVWTTGATMKEAAKVLKRNGVERVWGLTLAR